VRDQEKIRHLKSQIRFFEWHKSESGGRFKTKSMRRLYRKAKNDLKREYAQE